MKTITDLDIAVLTDNTDEVHSVIQELDRKTESAVFAKAAEHFGFKTIKHAGRRYAMRREISKIFGYTNESGLRKLCEKYQLETIQLGDRVLAGRDKAVEDLDLKRLDPKTALIGWEAFLLASIESTTPQARAVHGYLLAMERAARIAAGALLEKKTAANAEVKHIESLASAVIKLEKVKDERLRQFLTERLDDVLDGALGVTKQPDLFAPTSN